MGPEPKPAGHQEPFVGHQQVAPQSRLIGLLRVQTRHHRGNRVPFGSRQTPEGGAPIAEKDLI